MLTIVEKQLVAYFDSGQGYYKYMWVCIDICSTHCDIRREGDIKVTINISHFIATIFSIDT